MYIPLIFAGVGAAPHNPGRKSVVQVDRTVGITEIPLQALLDGIKRTFGFTPPAKHGHAAVASIRTIQHGSSNALIYLGGNLATAMPNPDVTFAAMRKLELVVHMQVEPFSSAVGEKQLICARSRPSAQAWPAQRCLIVRCPGRR